MTIMSETKYPKLIRLSEVLNRCPISRSTLYKQIKAGLFPRPVQISDNCVAWIESEIDKILLVKITAFDREQIKNLSESLKMDEIESSESSVDVLGHKFSHQRYW